MLKKLALFFILFLTIESFAQRTYELKDLFTDTPIIWCGIDYSRTEFIGNFIGKDMNEYLYAWNRLPFIESHKYDIKEFLQKEFILVETMHMDGINKKTEPNIQSVSSDSILSKKNIASMISKYQIEKSEGIGLVLIAERYNKARTFAAHYAVFFDIASRKILISQKYTTTPEGLGIRNFWAASILDAFKLLGKSFKGWRKKYGE